MRGPHGKGYAEMAVARVPNCGYETPIAEDLPFDDFETHSVSTIDSNILAHTPIKTALILL